MDAAFLAGMPLYVDRAILSLHWQSMTLSRSRGQGRCLQRSQISLRLRGQRRRRRSGERSSQDYETAPDLWDGLEHMRDYPDGRRYTDPAQVPAEDVLKVMVVSRRHRGRAGQDIIRQRIADPLQGAAGPGTRAAGAQEAGGPEPSGTLQDLLGLRLDGVVAYPREDGAVDVCAAGVDKSVCMRLPTGEGEPAASGRADTTERTAVMGQTPGLRHRPVSTWVAVGNDANDANDAAMIRAADIGVIVGDGLEEVRARRQTIRAPRAPRAPARWCPFWSSCLSCTNNVTSLDTKTAGLGQPQMKPHHPTSHESTNHHTTGTGPRRGPGRSGGGADPTSPAPRHTDPDRSHTTTGLVYRIGPTHTALVRCRDLTRLVQHGQWGT